MKPFIFFLVVRVVMAVLVTGFALYAFFTFQDIQLRVMAVVVASIIVASLFVEGGRV
jgi:hypothetical protein